MISMVFLPALRVLGRALEVEALQNFGIAQHGLVVERELRLGAMPQRDVGEFVRQHQRQAGFVGQNVDEPAADHDGVADRKRLQGRRQQHAAVRLDIQVRRHDQVVDDGVE